MAAILSDEEVFGGGAKTGAILSDADVFGASAAPKPKPIGRAANADFLREEMRNANWGTRQLAGFGTAASDLWEGVKQLVGKADVDQIEANKVIAQEAPVGAIAGNVAMTAIPFGIAGNSVKAATAIGGTMGALKPIEGEQTFENIARGKTKAALIDSALAGVGQLGANKAGEWVGGKLADLARMKSQNAPIDKTLADALDAGLKVTPTSANPTTWNAIKESIGGKIATGQEVSNANASVIDALARKSVGLADNAPLTSEAMQAIRKQAYMDGYEPLARSGIIKTDGQFGQELDALLASRKSASQSFPGAFEDTITPQISALKVGEFDAGGALKASQLLRDRANVAFRSGETETATAMKGAAKAIENQVERTLQGAGKNGAEMLKRFRDARTLMAKAHTVEDAIVEGGGSIDARKLAARVQAGKKLTDELAVIGNFANNFKSSVQPAKMVQGPAISKLDFAMAGAMGAGGYGMGDSPGAAAGALLPFIAPRAMRAHLMSSHSQNALRDLYKLGLPTRTANSLLQYLPVGGTVLGTETLSK